ncbi:MAG: hypothetical protein IM331_18410 [Microcystis sp. M038S1]|uniref:hypothetical protein n=1 Tax=Microcystis sp. M038S1 TaxID=2771113 RepID=UPI002585FC77|nr:hypothetical protein [Microcystis sp. M038S1]MCA2923837.1 hypothetical protein [Microcystis sp. M038S1]
MPKNRLLARPSNTKSSLKGLAEWGTPEQGETIDNLGVNHAIKKGFVMRIKKQQIAAEASCKNRHWRVNTIFQQMDIAYR